MPPAPKAQKTPPSYRILAKKPKKSVATTKAAAAKQETFTVAAESGTNLKRFRFAKPSVAFADLKSNQCRWPGEPSSPEAIVTHFCGKKAIAGTPYCAEHAAIAWTPAAVARHIARVREQEFQNSRGSVPAASAA